MSAKPTNTNDTRQERIAEETKAETVRRRANIQIEGAHGVHDSSRFLLACPPSAEIGELPELYEIFAEERGEQ